VTDLRVLWRSWRVQLLVGMMLIVLVMFGAAAALTFWQEQRATRAQSQTYVLAMARFLAASASNAVLSRDLAALSELLRALPEQQRLTRAMLLAQDGRILAHTDSTRSGLFLGDAASGRPPSSGWACSPCWSAWCSQFGPCSG